MSSSASNVSVTIAQVKQRLSDHRPSEGMPAFKRLVERAHRIFFEKRGIDPVTLKPTKPVKSA